MIILEETWEILRSTTFTCKSDPKAYSEWEKNGTSFLLPQLLKRKEGKICCIEFIDYSIVLSERRNHERLVKT